MMFRYENQSTFIELFDFSSLESFELLYGEEAAEFSEVVLDLSTAEYYADVWQLDSVSDVVGIKLDFYTIVGVIDDHIENDYFNSYDRDIMGIRDEIEYTNNVGYTPREFNEENFNKMMEIFYNEDVDVYVSLVIPAKDFYLENRIEESGGINNTQAFDGRYISECKREDECMPKNYYYDEKMSYEIIYSPQMELEWEMSGYLEREKYIYIFMQLFVVVAIFIIYFERKDKGDRNV